MKFLVWIRRNGNLHPQLWAERSFAIHKDGEPGVVARFEIAAEHVGKSIDELREVYPLQIETA